MRHRRKERHFLLHTAEHLIGVFVVLAIAFALGYVSKIIASPESMLAEVAGSNASGSTTLESVSFDAVKVNVACYNGATLGKYSFVINPIDAGYVMLTTPTGTDYVDIVNGRGVDRILPLGSYSWSGIPRSGFGGTGSGSFVINEMCSSSSVTLSPPPPPTVSAPIEISFSAQPGPIASCIETGQPMTPVFLLVTNTSGGHFLISSNTGMTNAHLDWGEYPLPNGTYTWQASVNSGYVGVGALNGQFVLSNTCDGTTTIAPLSPPPPPPPSTTITPTTTTVLPPPPPPPAPTITTTTPTVTQDPVLQVLPRPILSLFVDNQAILPIPTPVFDDSVVEVRIKTVLSSKVHVFLIDGLGGTKALGAAVRDDLLSRPGIDLWTFSWDTSSFLEGTYKIGTRVTHEDGRTTLSERTTLTIAHTPVAPEDEPMVDETSGTVNTSVQVTQAEKMAILERIIDPSACANAEECRIYCENNADDTARCTQFARALRETMVNRVEESLADGISNERLELLLRDSERRPKDLPEAITEPYELKRFCANPDNAELCTSILVRNDLGAPEDLLAKSGVIARAREEDRKVFTERIGVRAFIDSDDDGVTDYDELNIYGTNPINPDTDGDGFRDGAELLSRTNPLGGMTVKTEHRAGGATTSVEEISDESVALEDPNIAGVEEKDLLTVSHVAVAETGIGVSGTTTATKLRLSGRAAPNSFITLYIFSDPIVVTVKADSAGAWVYTLDKELPDGSHQIFSAITNAGGRILAKSAPLPFVKEAAAVSVITANAPLGSEEPGFFSGTSLYAMIAILIGILGAAFSIIGFMVRERKTEVVGGGPSDPTPA